MSFNSEIQPVAVTESSLTHKSFGRPTVPDDILSGRDTLQPKHYALMNDLPEGLRDQCRQQIRNLMDWMQEKPRVGRSFESEHYDIINNDTENMVIEYDEALFVDGKGVGVRSYHLKIQKFGEHLPIDFSYKTSLRDGVPMTPDEVDALCEPKNWRRLLSFNEFLVVDNSY